MMRNSTMPIVEAHTILPKGSWEGDPADTITLEEEDRYRRRILLTTDGGYDFLLALPSAERFEHGDALQLTDGRIIEVLAKPEALYEVRPTASTDLVTLAWHLGNRHQPTQIFKNHLRIRQDAVIADMLIGLGAELRDISGHFSPVSGAYKRAQNHHHHSDHEAKADHAH